MIRVIWNRPSVIEGRISDCRPDQVRRHVPDPEVDHLAPPERRQPAQLDREDEDQQDADEKGRQRDADQRNGLEQARQHAVAVEPAIDAERDAERHREQGRHEREFQRRGEALRDQLGNRQLELVAQPEIELQGAPDVPPELHEGGIVEAQHLAQGLALFGRRLGAHHLVDRIAHEAEHREGHERHDGHDQERLGETAHDEGEHALGSAREDGWHASPGRL